MQDKRKLAIEVDNVQKIYKLYDKPSDRSVIESRLSNLQK